MTPPAHSLGSAAITENLLKRKWSVVILRRLEDGLKHPEEIIACEADLSPTVMNERLRTMHRYCLIARFPHSSRPKMVDYRLTAKGRRILRMLELIERLDQFSNQDPRSVEDILLADREPAERSADDTSRKTPAVKLSAPVGKNPTVRIRKSA